MPLLLLLPLRSVVVAAVFLGPIRRTAENHAAPARTDPLGSRLVLCSKNVSILLSHRMDQNWDKQGQALFIVALTHKGYFILCQPLGRPVGSGMILRPAYPMGRIGPIKAKTNGALFSKPMSAAGEGEVQAERSEDSCRQPGKISGDIRPLQNEVAHTSGEIAYDAEYDHALRHENEPQHNHL